MSNRLLNTVFLLLFCASIALTFLAFFVWNNPRSYDVETGEPITQMHIEKCLLGEERHKVVIKGWAYVADHPHGRYQVYGQLEDGRYRQFTTFSQSRKDVAKQLQLEQTFKLLGFEANYRGLSSPYTGDILIRMVTPQGEVFSANYQCS